MIIFPCGSVNHNIHLNMRQITIMSILLFWGYAVMAQNTPDVWTETSKIKKVVVVRLKAGTDLLVGLSRAVKEEDIKNGLILNGIGSVTDYHFHVVSDSNLPPGEAFISESLPMDVLSVQGFIFEGRVHAHISLSDETKVIGGHLEPGTKALTFLIVTIGVLPDKADISNFDDYKY